MTAEELQARMAIQLTIGRYFTTVDEGRLDDFAATFTEDGVLVAIGGVTECRGRDAIREFIARSRDARKKSVEFAELRHFNTQSMIEVDSPTSARATTYFAGMTPRGVDHWGTYHDQLVPVGDEWLFQRREVSLLGVDPTGWAGSGAGGVVKFEE